MNYSKLNRANKTPGTDQISFEGTEGTVTDVKLFFVEILPPDADAIGQHPDLTGSASLRQDWHRAERKKIAQWAILEKESD